MLGWHHRLNGHESEQAPGDGEGQGSLACCSLWGCKVRLNNNHKEKNKPKSSGSMVEGGLIQSE